jgi:transposase
LLKHWDGLTLFLRQAGAPLDNNLCERALKRAILHRKNSLFYKTLKGAEVGDIYMSLIHTCQLCRVNPFAYLQALHGHAKEVLAQAAWWLPWNYREQLAGAA